MDEHLDELGGPRSYGIYPVGWALAMNTPYQWTKQVASHYGGTRDGMIASWPNGISAQGEIRSQRHHLIDILPTLLDVARLPEPETVNGVPQQPIEGVSMRYTFDDAEAADTGRSRTTGGSGTTRGPTRARPTTSRTPNPSGSASCSGCSSPRPSAIRCCRSTTG